MARRARPPLRADQVQGLKYLRAISTLLESLQQVPVHGNRQFFLDQYVGLLLLHFFNPVLQSLRSLQQASELPNVQQVLGMQRVSLGSLSESAGHVFDPALVEPILRQVAAQTAPLPADPLLGDLPGTLMAVDGTFLRCLPRMVWAVFRRKSSKRGARLHLQLDITRQVPTDWQLTAALGSEKKSLRQSLRAGMLYLVDRGYIDYRLYQAIHDIGSYFVGRLKANSTYQVLEERAVSPEDRRAGVVADQLVQMGSAFTEGHLTASVRRIVLVDPASQQEVILLSNLLEQPAELIGTLYRYRWQVELFFRWFKCVLKCTHWLSESPTGMALQIYVALLASMLIVLWTGRKPTRRTFEMLCLYFQGWAREEDLRRHIEGLKLIPPP